jgi:predicted Fe-Mo cluster-binding NifX family protein
MSYKIALATQDGENIDVSFGGAKEFLIYKVEKDGNYSFFQKRICHFDAAANQAPGCEGGQGGGCSLGGGCQHGGENAPKVKLIADCRVVICKKIGFGVCKQLERKSITAFDVQCSITEALNKITEYLAKVDGHQSLRNAGNNNHST